MVWAVSETGRPRWSRQALTLLLGALVAARIVYHSIYLAEDPFALATFSDGREYEHAALDILGAPPWGTRPFYLQGIYAYFMAVPMMIRPWPSLALLAQLLLGTGTLWLFHRLVREWMGDAAGAWATVVLLAYPMLAFYENKFLTAQLAISGSVAVLWTLQRVRRDPRPGRFAVLGAAVGVAILARPNFALLVPFAGLGLASLRATRTAKIRAVAWMLLGVVVALAPMAVRNAVVTDRPTVFPAHGGGTSFYIGNNASARGVWNDAGGFLSGDVSRERQELRGRLGVAHGSEDEEVATIGRELYGRAFDEIADHPGDWLWLEVRKLWLLAGSDELTQDYDLHGERELVGFDARVGVPFGMLWVLALFGGIRLFRLGRTEPERWRALGWVSLGLVASTVAANLLYFTSSQHRLPLVVVFAPLAIVGVTELRASVKRRAYAGPVIAILLLATTFIPRSKTDQPSAAHYYNVAVAWLSLDLPHEAMAALDDAVERAPSHPVIRVERARLRRAQGDFDGAREDLAAIELSVAPGWVQAQVADERDRFLGPATADAP